MLKSKAIDILKTFTKEEFKRFEDFVKSPYFNKSSSQIKLVSALSKFYPEFDSGEMTDEYIYELVYGTSKFSYSTLRNLMSEMIQTCESFILNDKFNHDPAEIRKHPMKLIESYQLRGLDNLFSLKLKKTETDLANSKIDGGYFELLSHLETCKQEYEYAKYNWSKELRDSFFRSAVYDLCSIAKSIYKNANAIVFSSLNIGGDVNESEFYRLFTKIDFAQLLKELGPQNSNEKIYIGLYFKLVQLTTSPESEEFYFEAKDSVSLNIDRFSNLEKYSLLCILRNYCRYKMDLNKTEFRDELYEINKMQLDNINFSEKNLRSALYNIYEETFGLAISRKDYVFIENLLSSYTPLLDDEVRDVVSSFVNAYLNFEYKNYDKTIQILSGIKIPNWHTHLRTKILYLKTYYEMEYYEEGFTLLDALKHYINKEEKLAEDGREYCKKMHKIFFSLFRLKTDLQKFSKIDVMALQKEINELSMVAGKEWLMEKTEMLIKGAGKK